MIKNSRKILSLIIVLLFLTQMTFTSKINSTSNLIQDNLETQDTWTERYMENEYANITQISMLSENGRLKWRILNALGYDSEEWGQSYDFETTMKSIIVSPNSTGFSWDSTFWRNYNTGNEIINRSETKYLDLQEGTIGRLWINALDPITPFKYTMDCFPYSTYGEIPYICPTQSDPRYYNSSYSNIRVDVRLDRDSVIYWNQSDTINVNMTALYYDLTLNLQIESDKYDKSNVRTFAYMPIIYNMNLSDPEGYEYLWQEIDPYNIHLTSPLYRLRLTDKSSGDTIFEDQSVQYFKAYRSINSDALRVINNWNNRIKCFVVNNTYITENGHYKGRYSFTNDLVYTQPSNFTYNNVLESYIYSEIDGHSKVLYANLDSTSNIIHYFPTTEVVTLELWIYLTNDTITSDLYFLDGAEQIQLQFIFDETGVIGYCDLGQVEQLTATTYNANQWYNVRMVYDKESNYMGYYFDDTLVYESDEVGYSNPAYKWQFSTSDSQVVYFDSIDISYEDGYYTGRSLDLDNSIVVNSIMDYNPNGVIDGYYDFEMVIESYQQVLHNLTINYYFYAITDGFNNIIENGTLEPNETEIIYTPPYYEECQITYVDQFNQFLEFENYLTYIDKVQIPRTFYAERNSNITIETNTTTNNELIQTYVYNVKQGSNLISIPIKSLKVNNFWDNGIITYISDQFPMNTTATAYIDFEQDTIGVAPPTYEIYNGSDHYTVQATPNGFGKCLKFDGVGEGHIAGGLTQQNQTFNSMIQIRFSMLGNDILSDDFRVYFGYYVTATIRIGIINLEDNMLSYYNRYSQRVKIMDAFNNTWYNIMIFVNFNTNTWNIYVNDTLYVSNERFITDEQCWEVYHSYRDLSITSWEHGIESYSLFDNYSVYGILDNNTFDINYPEGKIDNSDHYNFSISTNPLDETIVNYTNPFYYYGITDIYNNTLDTGFIDGTTNIINYVPLELTPTLITFVDQEGSLLEFNYYNTYLNNTKIYEPINNLYINSYYDIEVFDVLNNEVYSGSHIINRTNNEIVIQLDVYQLKIMNLMITSTNILIENYLSPYFISDWINPYELLVYELSPADYNITYTNELSETIKFEIDLSSDKTIVLQTLQKTLQISLFDESGFGVSVDNVRIYYDGLRTNGFVQTFDGTHHIKVMDFFNSTLFDSYVDITHFTEFNIYLPIYTLILQNYSNETMELVIEREGIPFAIIDQQIPAQSGYQFRFAKDLDYIVSWIYLNGTLGQQSSVRLDSNVKIESFGYATQASYLQLTDQLSTYEWVLLGVVAVGLIYGFARSVFVKTDTMKPKIEGLPKKRNGKRKR